MVAFERALERRSAGADGRRAHLGLLWSVIVTHEPVLLLGGVLLAAPDPPGNQCKAGEDDGTANANDDSDNGVPGLRGHARGLGTAAAVGEISGRGGSCLGRIGGGRSIRPCCRHNIGGGFDLPGVEEDEGGAGLAGRFRGGVLLGGADVEDATAG